MIINNLTTSLTTQRTLNLNTLNLNKSNEKLATGSRINRAADDPAGLITSENLRAVLAALDAESRNMQRADHITATADATLDEVANQTRRAQQLEIANANESGISQEEKQANQMEIDQIHESINRQLNNASFNNQNLFDGSLTLSAGDTTLSVDQLSLTSTATTSEDKLQELKDFRNTINTTRAQLGAFSKNTIASQLTNNAKTTQNIAAAESQIRDTNYAKQSAQSARLQLLTNSSTKALALTNLQNQQTLSLLA